jgi:hypothetical protein
MIKTSSGSPLDVDISIHVKKILQISRETVPLNLNHHDSTREIKYTVLHVESNKCVHKKCSYFKCVPVMFIFKDMIRAVAGAGDET